MEKEGIGGIGGWALLLIFLAIHALVAIGVLLARHFSPPAPSTTGNRAIHGSDSPVPWSKVGR